MPGSRMAETAGDPMIASQRCPDHALPPWAIDTIHDGVPRAAFRAAGPFALHTALNRIALSLQYRGGTYERYTD